MGRAGLPWPSLDVWLVFWYHADLLATEGPAVSYSGYSIVGSAWIEAKHPTGMVLAAGYSS